MYRLHRDSFSNDSESILKDSESILCSSQIEVCARNINITTLASYAVEFILLNNGQTTTCTIIFEIDCVEQHFGFCEDKAKGSVIRAILCAKSVAPNLKVVVL